MIDGLVGENTFRIFPETDSAVITSLQSARDFFNSFDGRKLKGVYCLDLDRERVKKIETLEEARIFYDYDPHRCECGSNWNEYGVCEDGQVED